METQPSVFENLDLARDGITLRCFVFKNFEDS
jgi:hypothetical protein